MTLSTAESCTGGLLASSLTDIQGASAWFVQGWITYSNDSKVEQLGIDRELFVEHEGSAGAVSEEVAMAMAEGAAKKAETDMAISITGIAGPTGATEEKEIGLIWVGVNIGDTIEARTASFGQGDRRSNKEAFSNFALRSALDIWDEHFIEDEDEEEEEEEIEQDDQPELDDALRTVEGKDANWEREVEWTPGEPKPYDDEGTDSTTLPESDINWGDE